MKKLLLTAVAVILAASSAFAGAKLNFIEPRLSVGLTLPESLQSGPIKVDVFRPGVTTNLDVAFNVGMGNRFYIEPAVGFFASRVNGNKDLYGNLSSELDMDINYVELGIDVPVMFGFKVMDLGATSLNIFTGPKCDIGISGRGNTKANLAGETVSESEDLYGDDFSRLNVQWGLGVGYTVNSVQFRFAGYLGLNNRYAGLDEVKYRQGAVMLSVGYQF